MRHPAGIVVAVLVAAAAAATPIVMSLRFAWQEGIANESSIALSYAQDALRRSNEISQQMTTGLDQLTHSGFAPCSQQEVDLMRKIEMESTYIHAIGRLANDSLVCTSLGTTQPIPLGKPTLITSNGAAERLNVQLALASGDPVDIFAKDHFAFLLNPKLPLDSPSDGRDVSIAIFVPSSPAHSIISSRNGSFPPDWFRTIPKGTTTWFLSHNYVVTIARAESIDVAVISAVPLSDAVDQVQHFATIFIPLGLLSASVLAWAVMRLSRLQLSLSALLRIAARRKEFCVEYQPIIELATGRCVGAEALVRWQRGGKLVEPDEFIPTAEHTGIISLITACVADLVAADLPSLLRVAPDFFVSMNLSAADLRSTKTLKLIESLLRRSNAGSHNLKVEATEYSFLQGEESRLVIDGIRALGVELAIDDFGTGYSSLSRVETLGLDVLKIDKSFVNTIGTDGATSHVVPHIIHMAHSLKLTVVAEGVATPDQARFLRMRCVHHVQGSLYGMPMSLDAILSILQFQTPVESPLLIS